jgi:hypothetical protein
MPPGFPQFAGTDAYSGATVADFNRVPISISERFHAFQTCCQALSKFQRTTLPTSIRHRCALQEKNIFYSGWPALV